MNHIPHPLKYCIFTILFFFQTNDSTGEEDPYEADTDIDEDVIKPETEMEVKKVKQETEIKPAKNGISKEKSSKTLSKFPPLPSYFDGKIFFVFGSFSTDEVRKSINRHSEPKWNISFRNF